MDLHVSLQAMKWLIALWRIVPVERFPIKELLIAELETISEEFSKGVELCLCESRMSEGWKTRTREFVGEHYSEPETTAYEREELDVALTMWSSSPRDLREFSYECFDRFLDETLPIFDSLVWEIACDLADKKTSEDNPLESLQAALSIWANLAPTSVLARDSEVLKPILMTHANVPRLSPAIRAHIADFCGDDDLVR